MLRWYNWLSFLFLLNAMDALGFIDRVAFGSWAEKGGDSITTVIRLSLLLLSITLFGYSYFKERNTRKLISTGGKLALFTVGFLFITSIWSMDARATILAATVYLFVLIGGIGIARIYAPEEYMHLLSCACFLTAIGSLLLIIVSPENAFAGQDFIGIFPHKNLLGQTMAAGVLASLHSIAVARRPSAFKIIILLVLVGMTVVAKSTAALLVTLSFLGISAIFTLWQKGGASRFVGMMMAAGMAFVLVAMFTAPDLVLEFIGKEPTLTGRTEIWDFVINDIWMKPLLGWGYYGFWHLSNPAAMEINDAILWVVPQAHNGLLELLLSIGVLGTSLFIWLFVRNLVFALRCLRTSANALAASAIMCCLGVLILGVSETVLLSATQPFTLIFFVTGLMCERAVSVKRRQYFQPQNSQYAVSLRRPQNAPPSVGVGRRPI